MEFSPIHDQVLIRPTNLPNQTASGLAIVRDQKVEYWRHGAVVAVGRGDILRDGTRAPMFTKPGDSVVYVTRRHHQAEWEGETCDVVLEEQSVMCITNGGGIQALYDRVVVKRDEPEHMTRGGLYIPEQALDKPGSGTVIAVGQGERNKKGRFLPICVAPGDHVHFSNFSGSNIEIHGVDYLVMRENDVLGVEELAA